MDTIAPLLATVNRSRLFGVRATTFTVESDRAVMPGSANQPAHPLEASHQHDHTWLSVPTVKRSRWLGNRETDVTPDPWPPLLATPPLTWNLGPAKRQQHRLSVRAVDPSGAESRPATYAFSYREPPRADAVRFGVAGDLAGLVPGLWREVSVRVTNPSAVPIRVTGVTLAIAPDSTPPGCLTATNLEVRQPVFTGGRALALPPRATVTLPTEGVSTAVIRLRDLPSVNQDVCEDKSFTLLWSGTAEL